MATSEIARGGKWGGMVGWGMVRWGWGMGMDINIGININTNDGICINMNSNASVGFNVQIEKGVGHRGNGCLTRRLSMSTGLAPQDEILGVYPQKPASVMLIYAMACIEATTPQHGEADNFVHSS